MTNIRFFCDCPDDRGAICNAASRSTDHQKHETIKRRDHGDETKGIKASVDTLTAYRERMLTTIRIVTRSP